MKQLFNQLIKTQLPTLSRGGVFFALSQKPDVQQLAQNIDTRLEQKDTIDSNSDFHNEGTNIAKKTNKITKALVSSPLLQNLPPLMKSSATKELSNQMTKLLENYEQQIDDSTSTSETDFSNLQNQLITALNALTPKNIILDAKKAKLGRLIEYYQEAKAGHEKSLKGEGLSEWLSGKLRKSGNKDLQRRKREIEALRTEIGTEDVQALEESDLQEMEGAGVFRGTINVLSTDIDFSRSGKVLGEYFKGVGSGIKEGFIMMLNPETWIMLVQLVGKAISNSKDFITNDMTFEQKQERIQLLMTNLYEKIQEMGTAFSELPEDQQGAKIGELIGSFIGAGAGMKVLGGVAKHTIVPVAKGAWKGGTTAAKTVYGSAKTNVTSEVTSAANKLRATSTIKKAEALVSKGKDKVGNKITERATKKAAKEAAKAQAAAAAVATKTAETIKEVSLRVQPQANQQYQLTKLAAEKSSIQTTVNTLTKKQAAYDDLIFFKKWFTKNPSKELDTAKTTLKASEQKLKAARTKASTTPKLTSPAEKMQTQILVLKSTRADLITNISRLNTQKGALNAELTALNEANFLKKLWISTKNLGSPEKALKADLASVEGALTKANQRLNATNKAIAGKEKALAKKVSGEITAQSTNKALKLPKFMTETPAKMYEWTKTATVGMLKDFVSILTKQRVSPFSKVNEAFKNQLRNMLQALKSRTLDKAISAQKQAAIARAITAIDNKLAILKGSKKQMLAGAAIAHTVNQEQKTTTPEATIPIKPVAAKKSTETTEQPFTSLSLDKKIAALKSNSPSKAVTKVKLALTRAIKTGLQGYRAGQDMWKPINKDIANIFGERINDGGSDKAIAFAKALQNQIGGIRVDGNIGPKTLKALAGCAKCNIA